MKKVSEKQIRLNVILINVQFGLLSCLSSFSDIQ